jgi:acetyltransferase-like isoleucine patch superfamily enzyme
MLRNLFQRILHKIAAIAPGGFSLRPRLHRLRGVKLGNNVWISQFVYIDELHPDAVTIKDNCTIGLRTSIFTHFYYGPKRSIEHAGPVVIEEDVFIGPHSVILPNVRIGRGAVIKAGSVVSRNVPPGVLWGSPSAEPIARVTVPMTMEHTYEEFVSGLRPIRKRKKQTTQQ